MKLRNFYGYLFFGLFIGVLNMVFTIYFNISERANISALVGLVFVLMLYYLIKENKNEN